MKKKVKIALSLGIGLLAAGTGIWFAVKKFQKTVTDVYPVSEIAQQVWQEMSTLDGSISSNMSQEVRLAEREIVSKVHVQEGQEVKEGDPLLTYDMTLVSIDLEMEKLSKKQLEIKKSGLDYELKKLKKIRTVGTYPGADYRLQMLTAPGDLPQELIQEPQPNPENPDEPKDPEIPENPDEPETPEEPEEPQQPSGTYKRLYWDLSVDNSAFPDDDAIIEQAVPVEGKGSKEDPLKFLCTKGVLIQGAFLNHIAGFDQEGERRPLYCRLEVKSGDAQDGVLLAAMLLDGSALENPVDPAAWFKTKLGQNEWEIMSPGEMGGEELPDGTGNIISGDDIAGGYSKEELAKAIAEKESEIASADLDIREADLKIKRKEKELQNETVCSIVNGTVKKVGNPEKGEIDGEPFIVVESTQGVYVQGRISEDMLGKISVGQMLNGMAYESGMPFSAEVKEISRFPSTDYYMGGQRQVSYYGFTAFIENAEGLKNHEMVSMDMPQAEGEITGLFVSKEYVRSKDGEDFVYKEGKNHKLKKQVVKTGKTYYGFLVEIKDGITEDDYLAFPYGKKVKAGAKVKRSSLSELYNMY